MNHTKLIDELLQELSYRVGIVDIYNKEQQSVMSEILTEWGEFEVKETIFRFLNEEEEEKRFKNPILNRKIKYVGKDGKEQEGLVGNLITAPKNSPGRIEAEKLLPKDGTPEREEINQEIGSQGGGGPQDDTTSGGTDSVEQDVQRGSAVKKGTKSGDSYHKNIVSKEEETQEKIDDEEEKSKQKPKTKEQKKAELKEKFSKKSEVAEGLVQDNGRELPNGTKVRDILDDEGNVIEVNTSEGRKRAAEVIRKRLDSLEEKIVEAINNFGETIEVKKWLGEVGEMSALAQILEEDVEAYLLTDSERKNDIVFIKSNGDESTLDTGYLSVKTTLQGEQVNQLGANCKSDLEKLTEVGKPEYETAINGKSFNLKPTNVLGSVIDIKSGFFAKFSIKDGVEKTAKGKLTRINEQVHKNISDDDIIEIDGVKYFKSQSTYLKNTPVTEDDINDFFDKEVEKYITNLSKPKKGETNKVEDSNDLEQTKEYLREMFLNDFKRKQEMGEEYTLFDMHDTMYHVIGKVSHESEMPIEATTDTMAIEFAGKNINPNVTVIKKEDANKDIEEQLNNNKVIVDDRERMTHLATSCLNIRSRTRAVGNPLRYDGIDNISPIAKKPTEKRTPISEYVKM